MLDVQLFGLRPGLHHFMSVVIHAGATIALFWFLCRTTANVWASAAVAALFAWHPMHVESVAWVAERKDVLCGLFFFLMLIAYRRYVGARSVANYLLVVLLFALALLSKPMAVTAPFVLLLVDCWPLKRTARWGLVVEKIPLFALAGVMAVVTYLAQKEQGAVRSDESLPLQWRLMNVPVAYVRYLAKLAWPSHLSVFYPYEVWAPAHVVAATLVLVVVTIFLIVAWQRGHAAPVVGWLWFLGMLVPVIGIVQAGSQSMADRYSYLPAVGIFIVSCYAMDWSKSARWICGVVLIGVMVVTSLQLQHWKNELALFEHAAAVTERNYLAEGFIGKALAAKDDDASALKHYDRALEWNPLYFEAHYNLGNLQLRQGVLEPAMGSYRRAIELRPGAVEPRNNLAVALALAGDLAKAESAARGAIAIDPEYADAHATLGRILLKQAKRNEAAGEFSIALRLNPQLEAAKRGLAEATTPP